MRLDNETFFPQQPLKAPRVLFAAKVCGLVSWMVGGVGEACPGYISGTLRCIKLILGRDIG